jgi:hypothetical protein
MFEPEAPRDGEELQFDRVVSQAASASPSGTLSVACAGCQTSIETEYYDVNGKTCCGRCRAAIEAAAETPQGILPLVIAGVFGLGAGVVGAAIYYAVMAIANLEIGIVAILIGYMVGYAVHKGAGLRGSRRFQVLAVALTYASVALAYTPLAFQEVLDADRGARKAAATTTSTDGNVAATAADGTSVATAIESTPAETTRPSGRRALFALAILLTFIAALPVMVVVGSLPSGLISAFIIFIGMRQAWRMTGVPLLQILGPYRVGAARTASA